MPHFIEQLQQEAAEAIETMKRAALIARYSHARAELMRHMLATARKARDKPRPDAIATIVGEWMDAWNLGHDDWPHIAREMTAFTETVLSYSEAPSDAGDAALRLASDALDEVLGREGTSLSDQMAFRSQCAHGWWELVEPTPADLPGGKPRPSIPQPRPGTPFWTTGCADFCR